MDNSNIKIVWINKGAWKKPGPIVYMGLMNALSFAWAGFDTDLFLHGHKDDCIDTDIINFYGQSSHPLLNIHPIENRGKFKRYLYEHAVEVISRYCESGRKVIVLTREIGVLTMLTSLKKRFPSLSVLHEVHDYYATIKHLPKKRFSDYRRMFSEHLSFGKLDGLICLTEYQRALYQQWFPQLSMTALPLGTHEFPPLSETCLEMRQKLRRIAYIGHLHEYKGLQLIFRLAKKIKDKNAEIVCYGGHAKHITELTQRAKQEGISETLSFVPFLSPAELHSVLSNQISIGLVPLQDTYYSRYLTCPVKALDFMSHGIPIVGSDVPSVREVTGRDDLVKASANESEYAEQICHLLDNHEVYQLACQQELARAKQISWSKRAERIVDFASA